jgi:hypothetical protein
MIFGPNNSLNDLKLWGNNDEIKAKYYGQHN